MDKSVLEGGSIVLDLFFILKVNEKLLKYLSRRKGFDEWWLFGDWSGEGDNRGRLVGMLLV